MNTLLKKTKKGVVALTSLLCLGVSQTICAQTNLAGGSIAKWEDNKSCAVALTFDDWTSGHPAIVVPALKSRGINATFNVVTSMVYDWSSLKSAVADGNELGNHTSTHNSMSISSCQTEVIDAKNLIEMNTGASVTTLAYPYGTYDDNVINFLKSNRFVGARGVYGISNFTYRFAGSDDDYYKLCTVGMDNSVSLEMFKSYIEKTIAGGGMIDYLYHSIYSESVPDASYAQIHQTNFEAQLDALVSYKDKVWITTFSNLIKYHREANSAVLQEIQPQQDGSWIINLVDGLSDNDLYNYPLSVSVYVADSEITSVTQNGKSLAFSISNDSILFKAVPDGGYITIKGVFSGAQEGGQGEDPQVSDKLIGKTAMEITSLIRVGWNLGNSLDANGSSGLSAETSWGNPVTTQSMIDKVQSAGFNAIRVPVSWAKHVSQNGQYTYAVDAQWMARVKEVVDYCYGKGMFVIINLHHDDDNFYPSSEKLSASKEYVKDLWTQIATEFADYDQHLIFECLNEPRLVGDTYEWWFIKSSPVSQVLDAILCINTLNQTAVDAIRGVNKGYNSERIIGCPGYDASIDGCTVSSYKLPNDVANNRLAVSVHAYLPYNFCGNADVSTGATDLFSESMKGEIKTLYETIDSYFIQKGVAAYIGETGCSSRNNPAEIVKWAECFFGYSKSYSVPCFIWDNNFFYENYVSSSQYNGTPYNASSFGLLNRATLTWNDEELIDVIMNATESQTENVSVVSTLTNEFKIYVNQGKIYVQNEAGVDRIDVFCLNGMHLKSQLFGGESSVEIDLGNKTKGVFVIVISSKKCTIEQKILL